jgi:hypothetical protein
MAGVQPQARAEVSVVADAGVRPDRGPGADSDLAGHLPVKRRDGLVCQACQCRWPCLEAQTRAMRRGHALSLPPEIRPNPQPQEAHARS